tara:strand:- start:1056 stop:1859 length:804 start_codon:yes stop_codon:yes gene_type:complete
MAEVQTIQNLPAPFIEAAGQTFLEQLQTAIGEAKQQDLTKLFGPQFVAGPSALTQQAQALAGGLGSFAPFLQTAAATTGPQAYKQFTSPFQKDVIDATLKEFDIQAAKGLPALRAQAISRGAFGGGREGVQLAEFQQASDRNRAALQSQLLQQGFGQAQQLAQQNFANQLNLAQTAPALFGQQISALGALGTQQQAQQQAQLSAQQQLLQQQANRPLNLAQQLGSGVTSLIAGYPAQFQTTVSPSPTPLQTAIGAGATLAGIYRAFN